MSRISRLMSKFRGRLDPLRGLDEQAWLDSVAKSSPLAVAVVEPQWRGVYSSMVNLFPACLAVRDALTRRSAARIADLILQTGTSRVVFAELPATYAHLLTALRNAPRKIDVYATWYNSFMMSSERSWKSLVALQANGGPKADQKNRFCQVGHGRRIQSAGHPRVTCAARDRQDAARGLGAAGGWPTSGNRRRRPCDSRELPLCHARGNDRNSRRRRPPGRRQSSGRGFFASCTSPRTFVAIRSRKTRFKRTCDRCT